MNPETNSEETLRNTGETEHQHHGSEDPEDYLKLTPENFPEVKSTAFYFIQLITSHAYIYLGLRPIPGTDQTMFKLDEARQAIDLAEVLGNFSKQYLSDQEIRDLDAAITQLRINFVSKSSKKAE